MKRHTSILTPSYIRGIARSMLRMIHPTVPPNPRDVDRFVETLTLLIALARKEK